MRDLLFSQKPSGFNTHAPDIGKKGFVEILTEKTKKELFVVHRLDKGTSGAMVFATSKNAAAEISLLFEKHQVQKKYIFLTDHDCNEDTFECSSYIEKHQGAFVSSLEREPNSKTHFKKIAVLGKYFLWEATPTTGKPHQIRLHAASRGIHVLGDRDHGGSPFYRLCLHSLSLQFEFQGKPISFEAQSPVWHTALLENPDLDQESLMILEAFQRRQWLFDFESQPEECLRLSHQDIDSYRIDMFGDWLWVYWYKDTDPNEKDLERFSHIAEKFHKKLLVRKMLNRGENPNAQILWPVIIPPPRWIASELGMKFECRSDTGLSPGLFLDQRENRHWVRDNSKDKCVLNLFSYTGGFSVNAALGGAKEIATVDVSANFIEWSKRNFELNGFILPPPTAPPPERPKLSYKSLMSDEIAEPRYEFWVQDSLLYLKGAAKRKRKFDLIICDPPSFGRSKGATFSITKNYEELLLSCLTCLGKGGQLLFCTNYEKWTFQDLLKNVQRLKNQFNFTVLPSPGLCLDFELPDEEPLMKSIILRRN
jgi:23S rRNA (cytosine1962-C5)-methyltransferase